ncbi:hypothetical protein PTKIN_Ptkin13bG0161200 [Pterospermum kingtungense]
MRMRLRDSLRNEDRQMKKLNGIKSKDRLIWVTISNITVEDSINPPKITFATPLGLSRSFSVALFETTEAE